MEKQRDAACTISRTLFSESGANSAALLEQSPAQHTARCCMDAAGPWQQPLGELGAPTLGATVDCEGEGVAPHFCQPQLSTQSKIYQGLLCNKSLENTAISAKSLATAAFSGGITVIRSLNHCRYGAAEPHTNLFN